jgi:hypothetical protein
MSMTKIRNLFGSIVSAEKVLIFLLKAFPFSMYILHHGITSYNFLQHLF